MNPLARIGNAIQQGFSNVRAKFKQSIGDTFKRDNIKASVAKTSQKWKDNIVAAPVDKKVTNIKVSSKNQKQKSTQAKVEKVNPNGQKEKPASTSEKLKVLSNKLKDKGLDKEGIFRKEGNKTQIAELVKNIETNTPINYENMDIHVIACAYKQILGKQPLFQAHDKAQLLKLYESVDKLDDDTKKEMVVKFFIDWEYDQETKAIMQDLLILVGQVVEKAGTNKMGELQLATVFSPRCVQESNDLNVNMAENPKIQEIIQILFENRDAILKAFNSDSAATTPTSSPSTSEKSASRKDISDEESSDPRVESSQDDLKETA